MTLYAKWVRTQPGVVEYLPDIPTEGDCGPHVLDEAGSHQGLPAETIRPDLLVKSQEVCMHTRKLAKAEWKAYFDRMSKPLGGRLAEIEIASLTLGHQVEANWLPLIGIAYDPKDDIVEIAVDQLDHMIQKPREIAVEEGPDGLASVEITDSDGVMQIVKLRSPLMLPAPSETK
jgi:Family of unknown function (DUF5335)